ncbi:hypothetical protein F5Y17DRAFT_156634 [Xylariaceae sp. FL0594]|nr:hypothetical protein F5Y17DRAFT_156634 [Xylariaceae sp. FL0594]
MVTLRGCCITTLCLHFLLLIDTFSDTQCCLCLSCIRSKCARALLIEESLFYIATGINRTAIEKKNKWVIDRASCVFYDMNRSNRSFFIGLCLK